MPRYQIVRHQELAAKAKDKDPCPPHSPYRLMTADDIAREPSAFTIPSRLAVRLQEAEKSRQERQQEPVPAEPSPGHDEDLPPPNP